MPKEKSVLYKLFNANSFLRLTKYCRRKCFVYIKTSLVGIVWNGNIFNALSKRVSLIVNTNERSTFNHGEGKIKQILATYLKQILIFGDIIPPLVFNNHLAFCKSLAPKESCLVVFPHNTSKQNWLTFFH